MKDLIVGIATVFVVAFMAIVGVIWSIIEFLVGLVVLLGAVIIGIVATVLGAFLAAITWPFVEAHKAYKRKNND